MHSRPGWASPCFLQQVEVLRPERQAKAARAEPSGAQHSPGGLRGARASRQQESREGRLGGAVATPGWQLGLPSGSPHPPDLTGNPTHLPTRHTAPLSAPTCSSWPGGTLPNRLGALLKAGCLGAHVGPALLQEPSPPGPGTQAFSDPTRPQLDSNLNPSWWLRGWEEKPDGATQTSHPQSCHPGRRRSWPASGAGIPTTGGEAGARTNKSEPHSQ